MDAFLTALTYTTEALRVVFLGAGIAVGAMCAVVWGVRTGRLAPFSAASRVSRRIMGPAVASMERRVVRAGGTPSSAPWWTLVVLLIAGILVLSLLDFVRSQVMVAMGAVHTGPRGVLRLLIHWAFAFMYIALIVRVVSSWLQMGRYNRFVGWTYTLTEPLLVPIRRLLPAFGSLDFSPIVAYFALRILEWLVMGVI